MFTVQGRDYWEHAIGQMIDRNVSSHEVETTINSGDSIKRKDKSKDNRYNYFNIHTHHTVITLGHNIVVSAIDTGETSMKKSLKRCYENKDRCTDDERKKIEKYAKEHNFYDELVSPL